MTCEMAMEKVVSRRRGRDAASPRHDLEYWLSKPPEERVAAVEHLRKQRHGSSVRLQRSARVVKRARG
jgi:hypothetical protein